MNYSDGVEYCGSPVKNKMNYAVISAYFVLFIFAVILDNFIQAIFLVVIYITVFLGVILWYSDREKWETGGKRIAHA
jgi:membrane associated rhomboid family serine protease